MVRLSKKAEYGLIAIRHIAAQRSSEVVTAKEISSLYGIPFELLAKVLQKLARSTAAKNASMSTCRIARGAVIEEYRGPEFAISERPRRPRPVVVDNA